MVGLKGGLPLVSRFNSYVVKILADVQFREVLSFLKLGDKLRYKEKGIFVFDRY